MKILVNGAEPFLNVFVSFFSLILMLMAVLESNDLKLGKIYYIKRKNYFEEL